MKIRNKISRPTRSRTTKETKMITRMRMTRRRTFAQWRSQRPGNRASALDVPSRAQVRYVMGTCLCRENGDPGLGRVNGPGLYL